MVGNSLVIMGNLSVSSCNPDLTGATCVDGRYIRYLNGDSPITVWMVVVRKNNKVGLIDGVYSTEEVANEHHQLMMQLDQYQQKGITVAVERIDNVINLDQIKQKYEMRNDGIAQLAGKAPHVWVTRTPYIF